MDGEGGGGGGGGSGGSDDDAFLLFKQSHVEIQCRLTAQLEDADARAHSLLVSYQQEEAVTQRQRAHIEQLQARVDELEKENTRLRNEAAAAHANANATPALAGPHETADSEPAADPVGAPSTEDVH